MNFPRHLGLFGLGLGWLGISLAEAPTKSITVEDAKEYAVRNNFEVQALKADIDAQQALVASSRSAFYPKLGVAGGLDTDGGLGNRETAPIGFVYGRMNLFNGFADQNEVKKSSVLLDISQSRYIQAVNELKLEVEDLFYDYLLRRRFIEFYTEAIDRNASHLRSVRKRRASGLVSDSDLMDFELRDSFLSSEINRTKQELAEIKLNLVRRMGPELGLAFEPKGDLPHWHLEGTVDSYLAQVKEKSESVRQAAFNSRGALVSLRAARAGWLPRVDLEARFGALPLADRPGNASPAYAAGLVASWDLFSGFQTTAETRKAEAELTRDELRAKQALLEAMAEVETAIRKLQSITQRVDLEENNEGRAERLYKSTLSEFSRGVKNGADVKAAEQAWLESKMRRTELKSEFVKTKIFVEKSFNVPVKVSELQDRHK